MDARGKLSVEGLRYLAVARDLEQRIAGGQLSAGTRIPGEHELARTFEVSRVTIRAALRLLARKGLVVRRAGAGTFVAPSERLHHDLALLENLFGQFAQQGVKTEAKILAYGYCSLDAINAEIMNDTEAVRLSRLWYVKGTPFAVTESYLHRDVQSVTRGDIETHPGYEVLNKLGHHITRADVKLRAERAGRDVGRALEVKAADPVLVLQRTSYAETDEPLEHTTCFVRPDKVEFVLAARATAIPAHSFQPLSKTTPHARRRPVKVHRRAP